MQDRYLRIFVCPVVFAAAVSGVSPVLFKGSAQAEAKAFHTLQSPYLV
jgi:hypothetical protein